MKKNKFTRVLSNRYEQLALNDSNHFGTLELLIHETSEIRPQFEHVLGTLGQYRRIVFKYSPETPKYKTREAK